MTKGFLMILLTFLIACKSRPTAIAADAGTVRDLAEASRQRFVTYQDTAGEAEQVQIIALSSDIAENAAGVQEVEPAILQTVELVALAAVMIAGVVLAWQLGVGLLLRRVFGWIPERERRAAKLLRESVAGETNLREAVAAMRAQDPLLDAAYRGK